MAELPVLAQPVELQALKPTDTCCYTPQGWAQGQAPGNFSRQLPASHLDIPVPSAPPLSRELPCSAPQYWYGHPLPSTSPSQKHFSAGMGNKLLSVYAVSGPRQTCRHYHQTRCDVEVCLSRKKTQACRTLSH